MSFLVEDDEQATLEVALAFIDACDDEDSSSGTATSYSSPSYSSSSTSDTHTTDDDDDHHHMMNAPGSLKVVIRSTQNNKLTAQQQQKQPPFQQKQPVAARATQLAVDKKDRAKSNATAVSRLRARKKAEAIFLREQVAELEVKLSQLQHAQRTGNSLQVLLHYHREVEKKAMSGEHRAGADALTIQPKPVSIWLDMAVMQARERYKSEALNIKLKNAIAKQVKISKSLEGILDKNGNAQGVDLLWDDQKQLLYNDTVLTHENAVLTELQANVEEMYHNSERISGTFSAENRNLSASSSTEVKEDPFRGQFLELRMNTPLPCGFYDAGQYMWRRITEAHGPSISSRYRMKKRVVTDSSFQKSYQLTLDGPVGPVELHGISFIRKFEDPHRVMYAWNSMIDASRNGLVFRERGWAISSSPGGVNPQYPTVFQTWYQIYCEPRKDTDFSKPDPHDESIKEVVMRTLSNRTRQQQQQLQDSMLDEFSGFRVRQPFSLAAQAIEC